MTPTTATTATTYRLAAPAPATPPPALDEHQRRVVDHPGGPLLVLAGPGTGKTTTLVEAIVDRVERRGAAPDSVLALTFSRKAAEQLRDRVTARLGRTTGTQLSSTFHSFAYSLVRRFAPAELYEGPLRLLSAPEQDVVLRELLTDHPESVRWPERLHRALGTRGFAREVHAVLARAREKGLDGHALHALGVAEGIDEMVAAGLFLEQYLDSLDSQGATDYADLIRRAQIEAEVNRDELLGRYQHVFVDEYQDTDPGQVALLRAITRGAQELVVVGDPHQSIYGFRGADVRGILEFPTRFPRPDGTPADVVALRTTRRFGPRILVAAQRVARRIGLPGTIDEAAREAFLAPVAERGAHGDGSVRVTTFDTERAEADHLADLLRRAHLEDGVAWDEMAVLVRSGRNHIPPLRRALGAAGVPVEVASDEVPLVRDPAVLPLLDALRAVVHLDVTDHDHVGYVDPGRAEALLTGPLGGLDAGDVRRLARQLRAREKDAAQASGATPRTSRELVRLAVVDAGHLDGLEGAEVDRARGLAALLARARAELEAGADAEELLWTLWAGTSWPQRLRRAVDTGGAAARRAHRDLDSVCALFDVAVRAGERREHLGVAAFLESLVQQEIPADTLADRGARGAAVRLLTAHRSKGLEWRLVVVAHVQDGAWPDLRRRTTLLQADRIGPPTATGEATLVPPVTARELLAEERRLFYVACTRARERLVVTAVRSPDDEGEQPSRFLEELVPTTDQIQHVVGRPPRPLSMGGLVADLRRTAADPAAPAALREAAARRLARLATATGAGERQLVPAADPATWWGTRAASRSVRPIREADQPVPVSASVLDAIAVCPDPVVPRGRGRWPGARAPVGQPRADRPRPRRAGRRRQRTGRPRPADGRGRRGVGPARLPHALVQAARARPGPRGAGAVPRLARRQPAPTARDRGAVLHGRGDGRRQPGPDPRLRRPGRARRRRPGRGRRPQDRPHRPRAVPPCGPTCSWRSTSTPSTPAPSTVPTRSSPGWSRGCRAGAARARGRFRRGHRAAAGAPRRRRRAASRVAGSGSPRRRGCCARSSSPRSRATTAAGAASSPCARRAAPDRWWCSDRRTGRRHGRHQRSCRPAAGDAGEVPRRARSSGGRSRRRSRRWSSSRVRAPARPR
ncbi:ATP-dependent helicase [Nocardioides sp. TF02-7]|uniref:ATP-dependent helicase n=1 Tax=Nocardioides sp. TF02-7 TaxID=2917724 RepID=UPI001F05B202|nr:ATP-dependent helicase [Nocardioides sp. TF02-7]UMG91801.1 ATP-dependent helicase [Nocardioides sp. TF02-7]